MITRTLLILFCLLLNFLGINGQVTNYNVVSVKEFTGNPWNFEPTVTAIQENYGSYLKKESYTIKNRFTPSQKDTIIRFFKGKTEIFFYRPYNGVPHFMAANIFDKRIKLKGNITPGLSADEFYKTLSYPETGNDTVKISLPDGAFRTSVILKANKIHHIKIEALNKNR